MAGSDYLRQRSLKFGRVEGLYRNILIIGSSDHVRSVFRAALGRNTTIREARTISLGLDHVLTKGPDVVCVDDPLASLEAMVEGARLLRRANYLGPVLLMTNTDAKALHAASKSLKRIGVLCRDEFNSLALLNALLNLTSTL